MKIYKPIFNTTRLLCCITLTISSISFANELISIEQAVAINYSTEVSKVYKIESSKDMVSWTIETQSWIVGSNDIQTYYTKATNKSNFYRSISAVRPQLVIDTIPANGSTNIPSTTSSITIKFPVDMKRGGTWGSYHSLGQRPQWGGTTWVDSRTLTREFTLSPHTKYAFVLNPENAQNLLFQTLDEIPIMPFIVTFETGE